MRGLRVCGVMGGVAAVFDMGRRSRVGSPDGAGPHIDVDADAGCRKPASLVSPKQSFTDRRGDES